MEPRVKSAIVKFTALLVPAVGIAAWVLMRNDPLSYASVVDKYL